MVFINIQSYCLLFQPSLWTGWCQTLSGKCSSWPQKWKTSEYFCLAKQVQVQFRARLSYLSLKDVRCFAWDGKINQKQGSIRQGFGIQQSTGFVLYIVCWHAYLFKRDVKTIILISWLEAVKDFMQHNEGHKVLNILSKLEIEDMN